MTGHPPLLVRIGEDSAAPRELLGGKASSLVTLASAGAKVPPAFVLTTEVHRRWSRSQEGALVDDLIDEGISYLERRSGRSFGGAVDGLVVSVRSGAPISMPGMMDTVLNVGLPSATTGTDDPFIEDARRRFRAQFAEVVLGLHEAAGQADPEWPAGPRDELRAAVLAVFRSWNSERAQLYRRMNAIPDELGTAVTVQQMVFGNRDEASGSGVAFTRDANTGAPGLRGEFVRQGQGEDVVSGRVTPDDLDRWRERQPDVHRELERLGSRLESEAQRVQEMEFTVESGDLYLLQARPAKLTVQAAARVAVDMVSEGLLGRAEAIGYAREHGFDPEASAERLAVSDGAAVAGRGIAVGGGVAVGRVALSSAAVVRFARAGDPAVFVTAETTPSHLPAMRRATGLLTMRGGATSHAAVVARELNKPCVVGAAGQLDGESVVLETRIEEGQIVTLDGDSGSVYEGDVTARVSALTPAEQKLNEWSGEE